MEILLDKNNGTQEIIQIQDGTILMVYDSISKIALYKHTANLKVGDKLLSSDKSAWYDILRLGPDNTKQVEKDRLDELLKPSSEEFWGIA